MRISDWSSDVCSSDLPATGLKSTPTFQDRLSSLRLVSPRMLSKASGRCPFSTPISGLPLASVSGSIALVQSPGCRGVDAPRPTRDLANVWIRSEERRVGKECVVRVDHGGCRIIKKKKRQK